MFTIDPFLKDCLQLITVVAADKKGPYAVMQWFERDHTLQDWRMVHHPCEVVVGKNGLAFGRSLLDVPGVPVCVPQTGEQTSEKREGDLKTPAGLFALSFAFGYEQNPDPTIKWPYLTLNENFVGVDDPNSRYYNCIVDQTKLKSDWSSSEIMLRPDGLYKWGLVIDYNLKDPIKGVGSQIFMHIWRGAGQGTEGCIAMPEEKMFELLHWIDGTKNPLLWVKGD